MNFKSAALFAAFAAAPVATANNLRGDALEIQEQRNLGNRFNEKLGRCTGATCGMWGDPHMITCDDLTYDCQGIGIFTLMKNHMYNVQANFVDVGAREHVKVKGWGLTHGASITNDVIIDYLQDDNVPVMQFGFGDVSNFIEEPPSEEGCEAMVTFHPLNMKGQGRSKEASVEDCRARCSKTKRCKQFTWWYDGGCHLYDGNQKKKASNPNWDRVIMGDLTDPLSTCGAKKDKSIELVGADEEQYHGQIGPGCPLLMYIDGNMIDLSHVDHSNSGSFLWGEAGDDHFVKQNGNEIRIAHKTSTGGWSEMLLKLKGDGPGELWSCHWDFYICLNSDQEELFKNSVGLLGSPDGDHTNDWMDKMGNILDFGSGHKQTKDYCVDNWCVNQKESIMTYHGDTTYEDHKCEKEDYFDIVEDNAICVLNADQIIFSCIDMPPMMVYACQLDCCLGGCDQMEESKDEIVVIKKLNDKVDDPKYNFEFEKVDSCTYTDKENTSSTTCLDSEIVKLLKTKGNEELPEDSDDLFYDIAFDYANNLVKFRVNNPFKASATVFVKHDKAALEGFLDPTCVGEELTSKGCDDDFSVEVACHDYDDIDSFALVTVYFASVAVSPLGEQPSIDKCCEPDEFAPAVGIAQYTFEVQCGCPAEIPQ